MNKNRKTLKMPVRYLMNLVLVGLLGWLTVFLTRRSIKKRRAKKEQKTQNGQNK